MEMSIHFPNLGIHLDHVGRAVELYGFHISYYGILLAVGMLLGIIYVVMLAKRTNQDQDAYLSLIIVSGIAAVVSARLFYVLFSMDLLKGQDLGIFNLRGGGLSLYGALLGGVVAAAIFCRVRKLPFWKMADTVCMGIVVVQFIGRWGNFFNRESFGGYTDSLAAMQIPASFARAGEITSQMKDHMVTIQGVEFLQVHPAFLYESLWCLVLLFFLMWYRSHRKFQGELFMVYVGGYSLGRLWIEGLRTDQLLIPGTRLPVSQILAGVLVMVCLADIIVRRTMAKKRRAARQRRKEEDYAAEEAMFSRSEESSRALDPLEINLEYYEPEIPDGKEEDFFEQEHLDQERAGEEPEIK